MNAESCLCLISGLICGIMNVEALAEASQRCLQMCDWCLEAAVTSGMKEFKARISMLLIKSHQSLSQLTPGESLHEHLIVAFCPSQGGFSPIQSDAIATYHLDLQGSWSPSQRAGRPTRTSFQFIAQPHGDKQQPLALILTPQDNPELSAHLMRTSLDCGRKP